MKEIVSEGDTVEECTNTRGSKLSKRERERGGGIERGTEEGIEREREGERQRERQR